MKVGVLGSGAVGQTLALGFANQGYSVKIGTSHAGKLSEWLENAGKNIEVGSFTDASAFGDIVVLAVKGSEAQNAVKQAGVENFSNKIVIDVTNPLVFEEGKPPALSVGYPDSMGKKIQELLPQARVVKAFNIVTAAYMTKAQLAEGTPDMFIAGNDSGAKSTVAEIARNWGWPVTDLGGIEQAYLLEVLAMTWITYGFRNNHWTHAFKLLKK